MIAEKIVLVTEDGQPRAVAEKLASHHANTPLHLAFSCYVFSNDGKVLVTRRALSKKVWPGVWTNAVCGHLAPGETTEDALKRRLLFELAMTAQDIRVILPDYRYKTPPFNGIIENEICPVYFARSNQHPQLNPDEVADFKWIKWSELMREVASKPDTTWSWWMKDQLKLLKQQTELAAYINPT